MDLVLQLGMLEQSHVLRINDTQCKQGGGVKLGSF